MKEQPIVLVTGAGGFVGGNLVDRLLREPVAIRAMVRNPAQVAELEAKGVDVVLGDLTDRETLRKAVNGVQGIYHIAALFRQAGFEEDVFDQVNAEGTRSLFNAAVEAGVQRVIHCSTVGVLGDIQNPPANEQTPYNPGDMYQRSKMKGEQIALDILRTERIGGVVIRPAMIYGPGDQRTLKLFHMVAKGRFFYVGKGDKTVHWIDVRDLADAFVLAMNQTERNAEVYIIAGKEAVPLKVMADAIAKELGVRRPWIHLPVKPMQWLGSACETVCRPLGIEPPIFRRRVDFYTKSRSFDASKGREHLGFKPAQDLAGELRDIITSYRQSGLL